MMVIDSMLICGIVVCVMYLSIYQDVAMTDQKRFLENVKSLSKGKLEVRYLPLIFFNSGAFIVCCNASALLMLSITVLTRV